MKLRNKKTGEIVENAYIRESHDFYNKRTIAVFVRDGNRPPERVSTGYETLAELNEEWEDYEEPKEYKYVLPNRVRRAIISWVKAQDNPIEKISILLKSYYDTNEVDSDGFYDYEFFGYVGNNNKNLVANTLSVRLKKPFVFSENRDYTLPELGIIGIFGGEE